MGRLDLKEGLRRISGVRRAARYRIARLKRDLHMGRVMALGMLSIRRPLMVHLIPMRRCNLACGYCNEFDNFSDPVPVEEMFRRIDRLADLGTAMITISGGEPLLHPQLDEIIAHIRKRGIVAMLLSNGYLLTEQRIKRLNAAGLEFLQVSIDNVKPDKVSMKSLKVLDQKMVLLERFAGFGVTINSVLGSGTEHPEDALEIARRATELGFTTSVGMFHNGRGHLKPLSETEEQVYREIQGIGRRRLGRLNGFEENLVQGKPNEWRCRAGARYLYVDENGLVHYCSQQRGYPAIPVSDYSEQDIRREYFTKKACAPFCTVSCVHQISSFDGWRDPQTLEQGAPESTTGPRRRSVS